MSETKLNNNQTNNEVSEKSNQQQEKESNKQINAKEQTTQQVSNTNKITLKEAKKLVEENKLFSSFIIKYKRGTHPNNTVNLILEKYFALKEETFLMPFAFRIITSLSLIASLFFLFYLPMWIIFSQMFHFYNFWRILNILIIPFFLIIFAFTAFNPIKIIDEKLLKYELLKRCKELDIL